MQVIFLFAVGVPARASARKVLVKQVVDKLRQVGGGPAEFMGIAEKVVFALLNGRA